MPELTPARGIITAPQTEPLSGTGQVSYGVTVGSTGATERWAYAPTINSPNGGVYDVTTGGVWTRATDLDASADFNGMPWFQVMEGNSRIGGSVWWYSGLQNPTLGTTNIVFTMRAHGDAWVPGTGMESFNNEMRLNEDFIGGEEAEAFITGLRPVWVSTSRVDIFPGKAYVPGYEAVVELEDAVSIAPAAGLNPQQVHLYLTRDINNNGVIVAIREALDGSPDAEPYAGEARTLDSAGDANFDNYRYVGSFVQNSAGQIVRFYYNPETGRYEYIAAWNATPLKVVDSAATTYQTVNLWEETTMALVPDGGGFATLFVSAGSAAIELSNPDVGSAVLYTQKIGSSAEKVFPLSSAGEFQFRNSAGGATALIAVMGYVMPRS